jgi:hypothetical protein
MTTGQQKREWLRENDTEGWRDLFEFASMTGLKQRCKICHQTGYLEGGVKPSPNSWSINHLMGHSPCPTCGKQFTAAGMPHHIAKMHGKEDDR